MGRITDGSQFINCYINGFSNGNIAGNDVPKKKLGLSACMRPS